MRYNEIPDETKVNSFKCGEQKSLPDYYETVVLDMLDFCGRFNDRVWIDLGAGSGSIGLALLKQIPDSLMTFIDPNPAALCQALKDANKQGVLSKTIAIVATAESLPLPDESVDVVVSRGSFYFWQDRAQGLREVWRVLRPGGRAMIGGGLGSEYPDWARKEFIKKQRKSQKHNDSDKIREFQDARSSETFRRLAMEADLPAFEVIGEGGLQTEDPKTGIGIWLRFIKEIKDDNE